MGQVRWPEDDRDALRSSVAPYQIADEVDRWVRASAKDRLQEYGPDLDLISTIKKIAEGDETTLGNLARKFLQRGFRKRKIPEMLEQAKRDAKAMLDQALGKSVGFPPPAQRSFESPVLAKGHAILVVAHFGMYEEDCHVLETKAINVHAALDDE